MAWEIGGEVGPYQITEQLGTGGMAAVYKAYQSRLERYVAIKVMHLMLVEDTTFLARFEREARIVARLDHPNIVPLYDYAEYDGQPYLVMKFIEGLTLKDLTQQTTLTPTEILQIMVPVASALQYAHEQGVLHRDVKPSNILLDRRGTPYVTDFGLARLVQAGESTLSVGSMLGTPYYISPEQGQGTNTDLDARADVYSLGVVLYELVTGRVPFMDKNSLAIINDHIHTPPPLPTEIKPDVPEAVEAVLLRALAKNRDERYSTPTEMIDAYREAINAPAADVDVTPSWVLNEALRRPRAAFKPGVPPRDSSFVKKMNAGFEDEHEEQDAEVTGNYLTPEQRLVKKIEKRIRKRQEAFRELAGSIVIFLVINVWLFGLGDWLGLLLNGENAGLPSVITMFWGLAVMGQMAKYYYDYGPGRVRREREIDRELERERQRLYGQKQKNDFSDRQIRLTEDGELSESFIDDDYDYKRKNR